VAGRGNVPSSPLKPPHWRHSIEQVRLWPRKVTSINTMIEPWVDVQADADAINHGAVARAGDTFTVNSRTYGFYQGRLFPISGAGFIQLNKTEYRILGIYNTFGDTAAAEQEIGHMRGVTQHEQDRARYVWQLGGRRQ
jgi:hypothetical protein